MAPKSKQNVFGNHAGAWEIKRFSEELPTECALIEGLPGIANVGKIAGDFIVEQKKAKKIYEFFSYDLPHSVFIKENSLVELPKIELYWAKKDKTLKRDIILLVGDVQPSSERGCYEFCELILEIVQNMGCNEIVTTGGIGLTKIPTNPKVYCTANDKEIVQKYKKLSNINHKTYGIVGPVVGITGVLVGLAGQRNIPAIALLAETFAHPMYLGMSSARQILNVIDKVFGLTLNLKNLDKEIEDLEKEIVVKTEQIRSLHDKIKEEKLNYIG